MGKGAVSLTRADRVSSYVETHSGGNVRDRVRDTDTVRPTRVKRVSSHVETYLGGMLYIGLEV